MRDVDLILTVRDRDYAGWKKIALERAVTNATATFGVIATRNWPGQAEEWDIRNGDRVSVSMNDQQIITGWIDQISPRYEHDQHEIEIAGRGLVCDLVDCTPEGAPTEWKKTPAGAIIRDIAAPFNIEVVIDADLGAPLDFKLQQGEAAWEAISRITKLRQVLAYEQADGSLLITRVSEEYCETPLVQGLNIKGATSLADDKDRYSIIIVKGQQNGATNVSPKQAAQSKGTAIDPSITRYRPLVLYQAANTTSQDATERALWEKQNRLGNGLNARISVQGWLTDQGTPWPLNRLARIYDTYLGLDRVLSIAELKFELGERGTTTELILKPPEALTPHPEDLKDETVKKKSGEGGGTSFWLQFAADRKAGEERRKESAQ